MHRAQQDVLYEMASLCQNVAIWLMKHAARVAAKEDISMDEAKVVHSCMRKAASIWRMSADKMIPLLTEMYPPGSDLDPTVLDAYINQCTAEAQEVTLGRAVEMKHNASLISALAYETSQMFSSAEKALSTQDISLFGSWRFYLKLKTAFYLAFAYNYVGENLLTVDKCGEAIRALQEGQKYYSEALELCKDYGKQKGPGKSAKLERHMFFRKLGPVIKRTLEKCERENGLIYHEKVPYDPPLLEKRSNTYGLVCPEDLPLPGPSSLWTPIVYKAIDLSRVTSTSDPANSAYKISCINDSNEQRALLDFRPKLIREMIEKYKGKEILLPSPEGAWSVSGSNFKSRFLPSRSSLYMNGVQDSVDSQPNTPEERSADFRHGLELKMLEKTSLQL
ncbi:unnamed protein product [Darwinula stevensoni]|uniref:BRO1 domain-containing protein n=1 Tax=Darwinula stevensoni TaxID=69355 RepID=A0A7R8X7Q4_9CRUS|nr:unnamed protein product [Darwinula stevensoni]CAG0883613.1 unnamed protein product [Darwinula stevensoni]